MVMELPVTTTTAASDNMHKKIPCAYDIFFVRYVSHMRKLVTIQLLCKCFWGRMNFKKCHLLHLIVAVRHMHSERDKPNEPNDMTTQTTTTTTKYNITR